MISKNAQAWGFDLMIGATLFVAGILLFYFYSLNYPTEGQETLDSLSYEGNFILDSLLSNGFPDDWNSESVVRIGLISDNKVNQTKLDRFYDLSVEPEGYSKSLGILNTKYNYFVNFSVDITITGIGVIEGIGMSYEGQDFENLFKLSRPIIYQNKVESLNLYIWE